METKDDAMALWCSVCRHVHKQGVKCPICGHTGKSRSYKCFKVAFTAFEFTVQRFDCQGQNKAVAGTIEALERANLALWNFVKILRGRIFGQFAKVHLNDPISRHLVSFVGDGPMGVASWRPLFEETGSHVVIIEHFGIVKPKRRQGYAKRFLRIVVEDVEAFYAQQSEHPQALVAYVPLNDSFVAMKLFQSVGFQPGSQMDVTKSNELLRMRMAWGCYHPV